jgi:hypothetical protein
MQVTFARKLVAEGLGTMLLVAAVVGSGIMAQQLARDPAAALLCNTIATSGALVAILLMFGPISGARRGSVPTAIRRHLHRAERHGRRDDVNGVVDLCRNRLAHSSQGGVRVRFFCTLDARHVGLRGGAQLDGTCRRTNGPGLSAASSR